MMDFLPVGERYHTHHMISFRQMPI